MNTFNLLIDEPINSGVLNKFVKKSRLHNENVTFEELVSRDILNLKSDQLPIGSILGLKKINEETEYFFKASPCFFSLQRDFYRFEKNFDNQLDEKTLTYICDLLNNNFSKNAFKFIVNDKFLLLKTNLNTDVKCFFPEQLNAFANKNFLPQGPDAMFWHQLINEIQMCLFDTDFNKKRIREGLPPINTIWFSGGGKLPSNLSIVHRKKIVTNSFLVKQMSLVDSSLMILPFEAVAPTNPISHANFYFDLRVTSEQRELILNYIEHCFSRNKLKQLQLKIIRENSCLVARTNWFSFINFSKQKIFHEFINEN